MAFFSLEDKFGEIECIAFPKKYNELYHEIHVDSAIYVEGTVSIKDDDPPKLLVNDILPLIEDKNYKKEAQASFREVKANEKEFQKTDTNSAPAVDPSRLSMYLSMYTGTAQPTQEITANADKAQETMRSLYSSAKEIKKTSEPPREKTIPSKVYLRVPNMSCREFLKAKNIIDIFNEGTIRVIFYDQSTAKYSEYSERMYFSKVAISELKKILGDDNVVMK